MRKAILGVAVSVLVLIETSCIQGQDSPGMYREAIAALLKTVEQRGEAGPVLVDFNFVYATEDRAVGREAIRGLGLREANLEDVEHCWPKDEAFPEGDWSCQFQFPVKLMLVVWPAQIEGSRGSVMIGFGWPGDDGLVTGVEALAIFEKAQGAWKVVETEIVH